MNQAEREAQIYIRLDATRNALEKFSVAELRGITLGYDMRISNLGTKRKADLIKAIRSNAKYKADIRKKAKKAIVPEVVEDKEIEIVKDKEIPVVDEPEEQTNIAYNIMERANRTSSTGPDWYANELQSELSLAGTEMNVDEIRVGDFLFFGYTARFAERYPYYDRRPLAYILEMKNDKMLGCNVHYLNPDIRDGFAQSMLNKSAIQVPSVFSKTIHSYFYTNISGVYRIPEGEYGDIARLVTEDFVDGDGEKYDINAVWDSVN